MKNKKRTINALIFWILLSIFFYGLGGIYLAVLVWAIAFGLGLLVKE